MKKRLFAWAVALALLLPFPAGVDDGGTKHYTAALWRLTLQHTLWQVDGVRGYLHGTRLRLLCFEVYDDVRFIPLEAALPE